MGLWYLAIIDQPAAAYQHFSNSLPAGLPLLPAGTSRVNVSIPPPFEIGITPASLILVVGVAQAFLLAVALWRRPFASQRFNTSPNRAYNPNWFLVVLMAFFGLLLLENFFKVTGYFYYLFNYLPSLLVGSLDALYFWFGPLLYFYTKSMIQPGSVKYRPLHLLHLLPFIMVSILAAPGRMADIDARLVDFYSEYYLDGVDISWHLHIDGFFGSSVVFDLGNYKENLVLELKTLLGVWLVYFHKAQLNWTFLAVSFSVYSALCFHSLRIHKARLSLVVSSMDTIGLFWLKRVLQLFVLAVATFILQIIAVRFLHIGSLEYQFIERLPLIFIVSLVYYIGYKALRQPQIFSAELAAALGALETPGEQEGSAGSKLHREPANQGAMENSQLAAIEQKKSKYRNSSLPQELSESLANDIRRYVETNKPYLNNQLTLPQLASELDLGTHMLSQLLNETIGQNFFDFINSYRVKEAQQLMLCASSTRKTILELGSECGFNSNSAFYNAFKKHTGMTPSQWKKRYKSR